MNGWLPLYTLNLVFSHRTVTMVFRSFLEIKTLLRHYFLPLQFYLNKTFKQKIQVPSIGYIMWKRFRFILFWKLARRNVVMADVKTMNRVPLHQLVNMTQRYIFNNLHSN